MNTPIPIWVAVSWVILTAGSFLLLGLLIREK